MKKTISFITCLLLLSFPASVFATESPITKTEIYTSQDSNQKYNFQMELEEDNIKYNLTSTSYKILSQTPITKTEHYTETAETTDLYSKNDYSAEQTVTATVDGQDYTLLLENISYENMTIYNRTADVSTTVKLTKQEITDEIDYEYEDTQTNQIVQVTLHQNAISETDEVQESTVEFNVVFHQYNSDEFVINDKLITADKSGTHPVSEVYYGDVKAESDYANSNGVITDIVWNGDSYNFNGEMCRNAIATLTTNEILYEVTYTNTVNLPNAEGFKAIAIYGADITTNSGQYDYKIEATAEYTAVDTGISPLFIGIGVLLLAILIAVVLVIIIAHKNKKTKIGGSSL